MPRCLGELLPSEIPAVVASMRTTRDHMKPDEIESQSCGVRLAAASVLGAKAMAQWKPLDGLRPFAAIPQLQLSMSNSQDRLSKIYVQTDIATNSNINPHGVQLSVQCHAFPSQGAIKKYGGYVCYKAVKIAR